MKWSFDVPKSIQPYRSHPLICRLAMCWNFLLSRLFLWVTRPLLTMLDRLCFLFLFARPLFGWLICRNHACCSPNAARPEAMTYRARLDRALHNAKTLPVHSESKFVLISDCHRGTGAPNDNFAKNQNLYFAAMSDYFDRGFTCIELGDGDELWENRKFQTIKETHSHVFWLLNKFYSEQRYYMIYGNHDLCKRNARFAEHHLSSYPCSTGELCPLFPGISCHEAIVLQNEETGTRFF